MKTKVAFGFIPVPVEETSNFLSGTPLTELLANHISDFVQLSSFIDGLNYGFLANTPVNSYQVRDASWVFSMSKDKSYAEVDKNKQYTIVTVILSQGMKHLGFHPVKPLKQLTWSDIDELLNHMDFESIRELSEWKSKYDNPMDWVFDEMDEMTKKYNRGM